MTAPPDPAALRVFDPFELPDWTGTEAVTWRAEGTLIERAYVRGALSAGQHRHQLDLLAVDAAIPGPACPPHLRTLAHQAWRLGEATLLVDQEQRVMVAAPGTEFDPNTTCEVLRRFAKAVGAPPHQLTVSIVL